MDRRHLALIPANFTTLSRFSVSLASIGQSRREPESKAVPPRSASRALIWGLITAALTS
jgi:hypothetical protein